MAMTVKVRRVFGAVTVGVLLVCSSFTVVTSRANDDTLTAGVFSPTRLAPDFSFRGPDGAEAKLSQYRGKVVLLAFGYTACTNVCPATLATLALVNKKLGADAKGVQVIYVTVDPERDDPERLKRYVRGFDPEFIGVSSTPEKLAKIRKEYGIEAKKAASKGGDYEVAHSSFIYLIDKQGQLQALMPFGQSADNFVHDVKILLRRPRAVL